MNNLMTTIAPITQELQDVIVGTMLGDAKMTWWNSGNAVYAYEQGALHKAMVFFVFGLFGAYVKQNMPIEYTRVDSRSGKITTSFYFSTVASSLFFPYAQMFYVKVEGTMRVIKVLPANIYDLLIPRALAFWIMDDGQYVARGGLTLCTDNFTLSEVNVLKEVLERKFDLTCTLHNKKGNKRIYISGRSLPKLRKLVAPHMHTMFLYKLDK